MTKVKSQGRTIIEQDGDIFLIMHPDGTVQSAATRAAAERKADTWRRRDLRTSGHQAGVGLTEIRSTP